MITTVQIAILVLLRDQIIGIFTSVDDIGDIISAAWPLLCTFTLFDTVQAMGLSVIRGSGKQASGAVLTLTAYWLLGIPLAYFFALYKGMGVRGLWIGPTAACAYLSLMYNILIMCINWPALFEEIRKRRDDENALKERLAAEKLRKQINDNASEDDQFKK